MIQVNDKDNLVIKINESYMGIQNASPILQQLKENTKSSKKDVLLDFELVKMIDSSGIAMLVQFMKYLTGKKRKMFLTNINPDIEQTFALVKLDKFFKKHQGA